MIYDSFRVVQLSHEPDTHQLLHCTLVREQGPVMQMMPPTKSRLRHTVVPELALLLLLAVLWGGSYPLTKLALKTMPPFTLVALRVSIAAVLLLVIAWWKHLCLPRET